jgi:hypothetical protein
MTVITRQLLQHWHNWCAHQGHVILRSNRQTVFCRIDARSQKPLLLLLLIILKETKPAAQVSAGWLVANVKVTRSCAGPCFIIATMRCLLSWLSCAICITSVASFAGLARSTQLLHVRSSARSHLRMSSSASYLETLSPATAPKQAVGPARTVIIGGGPRYVIAVHNLP